MVEGCVFGIALAARDFAVNLIGQIPQEADTVLHQLQEEEIK